MRRTALRYLLILAVVALGCSCSITRHVPQGSYVLEQNVIEVDKQVPKSERFTEPELSRFVRQAPSRKFLGTNFFMWIYSMSNPKKENWINRTLRKVGVAPTILDTTLMGRSAAMIQDYMHISGFFSATESVHLDTAKRRATVIYKTHQGTPYRIGKISYDFKDPSLRAVVCQDTASTLLRTGEVFNQNTLEAERTRIAAYLRNKGYYMFTVNNIRYIADSTVGNQTVSLKMEIMRTLTGYNNDGTPMMSNNTVFRIKDIYINPDYNPVIAATDTTYARNMDTLSYRGLSIIYNNKPRVRSRILRQVVNLYPNYLYSADEVKRAYDNIMRLGFFKSANIIFTEVKDSVASKNLVTFIGDENSTDTVPTNVASTTEGYLNCNIQCIPALRQSYKIELEYSNTADFNKIGATIGYQNRNLFRGAELFDISLTGAYELMRVSTRKSSFEIGGTVSMSFPRFITPFKVDRFNRAVNQRTKVEISINNQRRPYYHRTLSGVSWGYSWSNRGNSSFTLRPIDVNLVKMTYVDPTFLEDLQNPYLQNSYRDQLIAGISGTYVYNNQKLGSNANSLLFRVNWETTGNLIGGLAHLFSKPAAGKDYYELLGIQYSQYARMDATVSNKIAFGPKTSLVYRVYGGIGLPYGNSMSLPFDRLFYAGGSNSMRGWLVRTLGPGTKLREWSRYPQQMGSMRLEANLEGRFPVWGMLHGAVFFDLGNVWFTDGKNYASDEVFRFDTFFPQLAFNTGVGARFDLNFLILRLDWGIRLHDPNLPAGKRWIRDFKTKNTALHFAVGYPF